MKKFNKPETGGYIIASILLVIVGVLLFTVMILCITPKKTAKNCNDYSSYAAIVDAFKAGNRGLDGDNDGIPCENRK